jgi:ABC-type transport system substrate-binding protein
MAVAPPGKEGNELRHTSAPDSWQLRPLYEFLIGVDAQTGRLVPQLATGWSIEPDGQSFRFKLRPGVQFHYGQGTFSANDVVHSWQQVTREDSTHGQSNYWRGVVRDIEVVDDLLVVFHLTRPDGNFVRAVSENESGMEIRSKAHFDAQGSPSMQSKPAAGTGAYQLRERTQGSMMIFERVPFQHWRTMPDFPELEFRFQKEASTRLAGLIAGEVHLTALPQDLLPDAERRGMRVVSGLVPGLRTFVNLICCYQTDPKDPSKGWIHPDSPLMNVTVRRALDKAINRDEMNKAFFASKGEIMTLNAFHPTRPGWNPDWEKRYPDEYGYDPARARALLNEAGYTSSNPLSTTMFVHSLPEYAGAEDVSDAITGYWRSIGVNIESVPRDSGTIREQTRTFSLTNHFEVRGTSSGLFTAMNSFHWGFGARGGGAEDPELDRLVNLISNTTDEAKQDDLWRQVGNTMFDRHMSVPLFWLPAEIVVNPAVVSDYIFPGSITGAWTHTQNIEASK